MSLRPTATVIADSGFWLALWDERDEHHRWAQEQADNVLRVRHVMPWPILYETLRTRYVRRRWIIEQFSGFIQQPRVMRLDDRKYRADALDATLFAATQGYGHISLVDQVLRMIIADKSVNVDGLITCNKSDFLDVCVERGVEIL